jgi:hypothetical protein
MGDRLREFWDWLDNDAEEGYADDLIARGLYSPGMSLNLDDPATFGVLHGIACEEVGQPVNLWWWEEAERWDAESADEMHCAHGPTPATAVAALLLAYWSE